MSSAALIGYQVSVAQYRLDTVLANDGVQHLQAVETILKGGSQHLLETKTIDGIQVDFRSAESDFAKIQASLQLIPGVSTHLPVYGGELQAALALVPAALDASRAGVTGCDLFRILITRFQNPLTSKGQGLTATDMTTINRDAQQVITSLSQALDLLSQVKASDVQFNAKLSMTLATIQVQLPTIRQWLGVSEKLLPALPGLLGIGTPTSYLIEVLDSSELRPGGGFIGNYGIATLSGGRLSKANITDVDLLDRPFEAAGNTIAFPSAYGWFPFARSSWSLRDSNLDADFPTAARYGEQNYQKEGGTVPVQGVIAITPVLIQQALAVTGPIYIPEYQETITPENIIARIHFHQLGAAGEGPDTVASPDGHSSLRKRFTELLAEHFLDRIHQLSSSALPKLLQVLTNSVRTKDLQLYFNNSAAEATLHLAHIDSTIASPPGDGLMVVDANVSPNKANTFMHYTMNDQVTIDAQGDAIHHTRLTYAWTIAGVDYGLPLYRDFVRIYAPPNSNLLQRQGLLSPSTGEAFGRKAWSGTIYLTYGKVQTITLDWEVPHVAVQDAQGQWHYQYELQRQAGILWQSHVQITLPTHITLSSVQGGLQQSNAQQVQYTGTLNENTSMSASWK